LAFAQDTGSVVSPQSQAKETSPANKDNQNLTETEPNTLVSDQRIPSGARVFLAPMMNGFDIYVTAAIQKKKVPVVVVADRSKAEFEVTGIAETDKAGWAKMLFMGSQQTNESASVKMVNLKNGSVVFAYSVNKTNSVKGKQSAAEACAKHMKAKIID
jgi:hypothetical protein